MTCRVPMTIAAVLAFCIGAALGMWLHPSMPISAPPQASSPLPPAPQAKALPKIAVQPKVVYIYRDRPVPLPGATETESVTATARLDAEQRPYTLSTTLDMATGQSRIWAQPEAQAPYAWTGETRLGLHYGRRADAQIWRIGLHQDVFRLQSVHASAIANLDSDGEWFAGIGAEYKF